MSNQPWECPRCKRINAPFTPTCFCNPKSNDYTTIAGVCQECGGFYGTLNGQVKSCHCGKDLGCSCDALTQKEQSILDKIKKPLYTFAEVDHAIKNSRCTNCGSYHGIFQGRAVQCVDLQNGAIPTYCNGQAGIL